MRRTSRAEFPGYVEEVFEPDDAPAEGNGKPNGCDHNPPWPMLKSAGHHGLADEVVAELSPQTESDPVAILIQLLVSLAMRSAASLLSLVSVAKPYFAAQDRDFRGETGAVLAG
jgi:hypothetical protein